MAEENKNIQNQDDEKKKKKLLLILLPSLGGAATILATLIPVVSCSINKQTNNYTGKLLDVTITDQHYKTNIKNNVATIIGSNFILNSETNKYEIDITIEKPKNLNSNDNLIATVDGENQPVTVLENEIIVTYSAPSDTHLPFNLPLQIKWDDDCGENRDNYNIIIESDKPEEPIIIDGPEITFVVNENEQFNLTTKSLPDSTTEFRIEQAPESPTFNTYLFRGWYTEPDGRGEKVDLINHIFTSSQTLYAKWVSLLHFETNGAGNTYEDLEITRNEILDFTQFNENTDENYTFDGWYKDETLENEKIENTLLIDGETTIYARWVSKLVFNNGDQTQSFEVLKGESFDLNLVDQTFGDYHLEAWCLDETLETPVEQSFIPEGNMNLYPKLYTTLSFNTDGGEAIEPIKAYKDQEIDLSSVTTSLKDYSFRGWYTQANGNGNKVDKLNVLNDTTLYASYNGVIKFHCNSGNQVADKGFIKNQSVTLNEKTSANNYRFVGWTTENGKKNTLVTTFKPTAGNTTVYAYLVSDITLKNGNGYQKDSKQEVFIGQTVAISHGSCSYTFKGIYSDSGYKNKINDASYTPKGHVTLYAKWVSTVSFYNPVTWSPGGFALLIKNYEYYSSQEVEIGKSITLPDMTTKCNLPYLNDSFYTASLAPNSDPNSHAGSKVGNKGQAYTPTGSITLYGQSS